MVVVQNVECTVFLMSLLCHLRYVQVFICVIVMALHPQTSQFDRNQGQQVMGSIGYIIA
jgi:hypothetical protein